MMRKDFEATEFNDGRRRSGHLPQTVDYRPCDFEIGGFEPFSKPIIDRHEEGNTFRASVLVAPKTCKARRGTQLPRQRLLPTSPIESLPEVCFGRGGVLGAPQ